MAKRILSIQSHVVSGYCGNKSATFPLQLLGFDVDAINSVQFSNHTGYKDGFRGQVLNDAQLWELFEGLQANSLDNYSHVINGYIGAPSFLQKFAEVVTTLKTSNPSLVYICDPVMGDFGPGMYVPESLLPIYKKDILPLADVCLPNQFEAELLTDMKIKNESDALSAMRKIHDLGVKTVILSSTELASSGNELVVLASKMNDGKEETVRIVIPKLPAAFVGTGDLFTALTTAWLHKTGNDLSKTLESVIATMQAVLKRTLDSAVGVENPGPRERELKLIQSKRDIEEPQVNIRAEKL